MSYIIAYSLLIMLASLIGVFTIWGKAGATIERNLHFLVSFSAGVFLVIATQLGKETLEHAETVPIGLAWIVAGTISIWLLFKFLPFFHHHHDESENHSSHSGIDARRILASDSIHNIGDGILLTASFGVNPALGTVTALSILIHELVQEVSEFFVLKQAGYSTAKALWLNFLASSTILVGAIGSYFLLETFEALEVVLLGFSAGAFFVVVVHDLIPHSIKSPAFKIHYIKHISWFVAGLLVMFAITSFAAHSHEHEHEHEEELVIVTTSSSMTHI